MNALVLLLTLTSTLVLRSGDRIAVEGKPQEANGVITFRTGGVLYSMPASEVERIEEGKPRDDGRNALPRRLRASEEERKRLLAELERNHSGGPAPSQPSLETAPPPPPASEKYEESQWRRKARAHQETLRRAEEELELLENRASELRSEIQSFISQGFKPHQFTYQTTQMQYTLDAIPAARLEITRATRAYEQFREDARREGVMPGWLR
jgi:DNA repair exonuclease SbcCD ATPase subunit